MKKNSREELITNIGNLLKKHSNSGIQHKLSYTMKRWELELVADLIIEDRKRIVGPLVRWKNRDKSGKYRWPGDIEEVDETLKLAGVE